MQPNLEVQLAISKTETATSEAPLNKALSSKTPSGNLAEEMEAYKKVYEQPIDDIESATKDIGLEVAKPTELAPGTVEMTPAQLKKFRLEGYRVVFGGVLIHLILGTFYIWGSISLYVASWLRDKDSSVDIGLVKMVFPFMNLAINITMTHGIKWGAKFGQRKWCCFGIILIAVFTFVASFIRGFVGFLLVYGVVVGLANGFIYMTPVTCGWKYFPNNKGAVSGWIIGGFGFGAFIFNYVALALVNPDNETPSVLFDETKYYVPEIYNNVPKMLRILAACYLALGLFGCSLIKMPKVTPANLSFQANKNPNTPVNQGVDTVTQGLFTISCLVLYLISFGGTFYGLMMSNSYKIYGLLKISNDLFLTTVGSVGSAVNGCFRIIWATLSDKYGFKKVMCALLVVQAIFCATYQAISGNEGLFFVWYCVSMACEGGVFTLMPAITGRIFGPKKGSLIYPFVYFGLTSANLAAFFISKYQQKHIGWSGMFWLSFGLTLCAIVLTIVFNERPDFSKKRGLKKAEKPVEEVK